MKGLGAAFVAIGLSLVLWSVVGYMRSPG